MTPRDLRREIAELLGDTTAARWLVETATGIDDWGADGGIDVTERMVAHLDAMVARHRAGEPLQYVLGRWGFRHLDLAVDQRVLIPRPETELVVAAVLDVLDDADHRRVADLGCGSGAIGLAVASELPLEGTSVLMSDVDADALSVARANLAGIGRAARNVTVVLGDWCAPLRGLDPFDVIVSNPPYIALDDPDVEPVVAQYEPAIALFSGSDGLDALRTLAREAPGHLVPGGWLIVEIGTSQGVAVRELFSAAGLVDVSVDIDHGGHDRVVRGRRPSE